MPWLQPVNLNSVPGTWISTPAIQADVVRISHNTSALNNSFFNGTIAQAEIDDNGSLNLYDLREINSSSDVLIFEFVKPSAFTNRCLAFKAEPYPLLAPGQIWNWELVVTPFVKSEIIPISLINNLSATPSAPIQVNSDRTGLTIFNSLNTTIFVDIFDTVSPASYWFKLDPGDFYEMPQPVYTGVLWLVLQSGTGSIQIREF